MLLKKSRKPIQNIVQHAIRQEALKMGAAHSVKVRAPLVRKGKWVGNLFIELSIIVHYWIMP